MKCPIVAEEKEDKKRERWTDRERETKRERQRNRQTESERLKCNERRESYIESEIGR